MGKRSSLLWATLCATVLSAVPLSTAATAAAADGGTLPTRTEIQQLFGDQVNRFTFTPSGFDGRRLVASWTRATEISFPRGRPEAADHPLRPLAATLPGETLRVFGRHAPTGTEYGVWEQVANRPANPFPLFAGDPSAFVFYDATNPAAEEQNTCRTLDVFLVCRDVHYPDGTVAYDTLVPATADGIPAPVSTLPSDRRMLALFTDQLGRRTFRPTHVGAWTLDVHWRRVAQIAFNAGADELVVDPMVIDPIPKELRLYQRAFGRTTQTGLIEWADRTPLGQGEGELINPFPAFSGDLVSWVFFDTDLLGTNDYQETCRPLSLDRGDFLICRTVLQGQSAFYQTYIPVQPPVPLP